MCPRCHATFSCPARGGGPLKASFRCTFKNFLFRLHWTRPKAFMSQYFSHLKRISQAIVRHTDNKKVSAACSVFATTVFKCFTIVFGRSDLSTIRKQQRGEKAVIFAFVVTHKSRRMREKHVAVDGGSRPFDDRLSLRLLITPKRPTDPAKSLVCLWRHDCYRLLIHIFM